MKHYYHIKLVLCCFSENWSEAEPLLLDVARHFARVSCFLSCHNFLVFVLVSRVCASNSCFFHQIVTEYHSRALRIITEVLWRLSVPPVLFMHCFRVFRVGGEGRESSSIHSPEMKDAIDNTHIFVGCFPFRFCPLLLAANKWAISDRARAFFFFPWCA